MDFNIFTFVQNFFANPDFIAKLFLVFFIAFYSIFAFIVAIQIRILNNIVNQVTFSPIFKTLGFAHFIGSVVLLIIVVLFL